MFLATNEHKAKRCKIVQETLEVLNFIIFMFAMIIQNTILDTILSKANKSLKFFEVSRTLKLFCVNQL